MRTGPAPGPAGIALALGLVAFGLRVWAHDIPNERVDRGLQIEVTPGALRIDYEVSLAELTAAQDLRRLIGSLPGADRDLLFQRYGEEVGPLNARGILVEIDGQEQSLAVAGFDLAVEEHPRYLFHFRCDLPERGRVRVLDQNYVSSEGISRLALRATAGVRLSGGYDGPTRLDEAPSRPVWMLDDTQERATHEVTFGFESREGHPAAETSPAAAAAAPPSPTTAGPSAPGPSSKLSRLLGPESGWGAVGVWCLAVLFGAVHAAQPGHGKTLVAAASLAAHRRGAGVIVGLATTLTHMASVLAIAAVLWFTRSTRYGAIQTTLAHAAGFVIAAVGLYRLGRAIGNSPSHRHVLGHPEGESSERLRGLLALGVSGGLVPCWDAVLLILLADLAGRLPWGIVLLAGFSLGMAAVLTAIGLAVGRARRWLNARGPTDRLERALSLVAGVALTAVGGYLWVAT